MRPFSRSKFKQKFVLAGTQSPPGRTLGRYNFIKFIIKYFKVVICNFNKFGKLKQQKFFLRRRKFKCADTGRPNRHPLGLQVSSNCINLLTWLELIDWAAEWRGGPCFMVPHFRQRTHRWNGPPAAYDFGCNFPSLRHVTIFVNWLDFSNESARQD